MSDYTENKDNPSMHIAVFTGGAYPEPEKTKNYWNAVSKPDLVIAADSGLETLQKYTACFPDTVSAPDRILGDMDSISDMHLIDTYPPAIVAKYKTDKDLTDTELALTYGYEKSEGRTRFVTLVGGDGGRVDHFLGIYDLFSTDLHPDAWLCRDQMLLYLEKDTSVFFRCENEKDYISISRLNGNRSGGSIHTEGLEWEYPVFRKTGMPSISNRMKKSWYTSGRNAEISVTEGTFIVILPVTAAVEYRRKGK